MGKNRNKAKTAGQQAAAQQSMASEPTPQGVPEGDYTPGAMSIHEPVPSPPPRIIAIQLMNASGMPALDIPRYVLGHTTILADVGRVAVKFIEIGNDIQIEWQDGSTTKFKNVPMEVEYETQ